MGEGDSMRNFTEIKVEHRRMVELPTHDEEALVIRLATLTALEWAMGIGQVSPSEALKQTADIIKQEGAHGQN